MSYEFLEDIGIADVVVEVKTKNLNQLFKDAATAMFEVMVDLKDVKNKIKKQIKLENEKIDDLLFDFLTELVYIKDANYLIFSKFDVKIKENKKYKLQAIVYGEKINQDKHELKSDVKAVTLHMFYVTKIRDTWKSRILFDV